MFQYRLDPADVTRQVRAALAEDIGGGDLTAALIPPTRRARASRAPVGSLATTPAMQRSVTGR